MIVRLYHSATTSAVFSAGELPSALYGPLLRHVIVPRVLTSSMVPTIRERDCLELDQPNTLQAGDIVVFRHENLFVCHRIVRVENEWLVVRGDATDGPPDRIGTRDVIGRVTAILRNGKRSDIRIGVQPQRESRSLPKLKRSVVGTQEWMKGVLRSVVRIVFTRPFVGAAMRYLLRQVATIDVMERAPLRSLAASVRRQSLRLRDAIRIQRTLADFATGRDHFHLVIRVGPFHLASCRFHPWLVHIKPIAKPFGLDMVFEKWRRDNSAATGESIS